MRHSTTFAAVTGAITLALLCQAAHAGDVYKYTDERGNTLYTDKPMPGAVKVSSGVVRPPEATARSYAAQQTASNQQLAASNDRISQSQNDSRIAANVAKDLEATRIERCKKARADYDTSINHRRMYREDKDGTRTYLSDAELGQQRIDAAKAVEAICGPQG
jgi:Domain of unknown function (DUF4124)